MFRAPPLHRTFTAALRDATSTSAPTRASAVRDLVAYVDEDRPQVIAALEAALGDASAHVRAAAAVGLADTRGVEALTKLLVAIEDDDAQVRQMALSALGEIGDPRARERLRRALSDQRPEVRFQALIAFSRVAPDEALDALVSGMNDEDSAIRYIAVRCAEEHVADAPEPHSSFGSKLVALLADSNAPVRAAAAIVLARSGHSAAVQTLLDVVGGRGGSVDGEDEAAAVELIGDLGVERAIPMLERRAFGFFSFGQGAFSWQATVALAKMGHPRAKLRIVRDLGSWSRDRRTLAVAAAGRAKMVEARPLIAAMKGDARRAEPSAVDHTLSELGEMNALPGAAT
ncbi:MAG TPA: HEAT repeat domain-containing protein [Polyangiaceae bacterium]|jgi:HEAT repeat protein